MKKSLLFALAAVARLGACNNAEKAQKSGETTASDTTEVRTVECVASGDVVYVQLDSVLNASKLYAKEGTALQNKVKTFQEKLDKGLMTRSVAEAQGQKLQEQEIEFNNYAAQKQQEIQEEQVVMMNQLGDAIQTFLDSYNKEKQYAMIITNSGGAPVITADPALDITEDVIAGLNEQYIKTKSAK